jgi:hypothetical protein
MAAPFNDSSDYYVTADPSKPQPGHTWATTVCCVIIGLPVLVGSMLLMIAGLLHWLIRAGLQRYVGRARLDRFRVIDGPGERQAGMD